MWFCVALQKGLCRSPLCPRTLLPGGENGWAAAEFIPLLSRRGSLRSGRGLQQPGPGLEPPRRWASGLCGSTLEFQAHPEAAAEAAWGGSQGPGCMVERGQRRHPPLQHLRQHRQQGGCGGCLRDPYPAFTPALVTPGAPSRLPAGSQLSSVAQCLSLPSVAQKMGEKNPSS